jgi:RNA polymerase sigma factor (sigma-70 family)
MEDDLQLLARIVAGDKNALGHLYDRWSTPVYSLARRLAGEGALAEDIVQEAFLKLWQKAATFDPRRGRPGTWILHLAYTTGVDLLRKRGRALPTRLPEPLEEADPHADPAGDAELALMGAEVRTALLRLPPEQRQALDLAYWGALTHQEIAAQLNLPLGTVKSRIRLALQALRTLLQTPTRQEVARHVRLPRP